MSVWQKIKNNQKGFALPAVLALLVVGGLIIVPSLNYAATVIKTSQVIQKGVKGIYAADSGIEYAIWEMKKGIAPSTQLPELMNGLEVSLAIDDHDTQTYTLYMGTFVQTSGHFSYLRVSGNLVWVGSPVNAWQYTITVERQASPTIFLEEVGARLPDGFTYVAHSAQGFSDNLSMGEPRIIQNGPVCMVNWGDPTGLHIKIDNAHPVGTQTFYVTGPNGPGGEYAWVVAQPDSIDIVGEISGTLYRIISTATDPATHSITGQVTADIMVIAGEPEIISWQVTR